MGSEPAQRANQRGRRSGRNDEMTESREATDVDALGEIMLIQGTMQRQFLRVMLRRLASDVPSLQRRAPSRRTRSDAGKPRGRPRPLRVAWLCAEGMGEAFGDGARRHRLYPRAAGAPLGFPPRTWNGSLPVSRCLERGVGLRYLPGGLSVRTSLGVPKGLRGGELRRPVEPDPDHAGGGIEILPQPSAFEFSFVGAFRFFRDL